MKTTMTKTTPRPSSKPRETSRRLYTLQRHPVTNYALNLTVVYEDAQTREWAMQVHDRVAHIAGPECVHSTWWNLSDLGEPGVLAGAVSTAMRADVVVVAIRATEGLPLPFYVWVREWLPNHVPAAGALVALLPMTSDADCRAGRVKQYLEAVAKQCNLEFLLEERPLPF
jgi:hypothetical protein